MDGQRPGQTQEDDPDDLAVPAAGGGRDRAAAAEELPRVTDAPSSLVFILDLFLNVCFTLIYLIYVTYVWTKPSNVVSAAALQPERSQSNNVQDYGNSVFSN